MATVAGLPKVPIDGPIVDYRRAEFIDLMPRWTLIRDVLSSGAKVKEKKDEYLPRPNPSDHSQENSDRYNQYLQRAIFYGVTARTLRGMVGEVFGREPILTLPAELEVMRVDVDGAGVSLDQQARKAVSHVVAYGRAGLLTDYPELTQAASKQELEDGFVRPTVTLYDPWDVINWRSETVGVKKLLSLVVLSEKEIVDDDGFRNTYDPYYRVLRLDGGVYHSQVWYLDEDKQIFVMESDIVPLDADGQPWKEIPFIFIGAENNDPQPDLPPMYDLAELNIGHYRNSADYEESCFICGQPTPVFTGLTETWVKNVLKGQVQLGSRAAVPLPEGAGAELLQAVPNSMPFEAMEHKERQMVALGAKLVEQKQVQRTATEASADTQSNTSLLAMAANNVSAAYQAALMWAAKYNGTKLVDTEEGKAISYELNTEFSFGSLAAPEVTAIIAAWQANAISKTEMRDNLRNGGWASQTDEEYQAEVDSAGIDLGAPVGSPASAAAQQAQAAADAAKLAADTKLKTGSKAGLP